MLEELVSYGIPTSAGQVSGVGEGTQQAAAPAMCDSWTLGNLAASA